MVSVYCHNKATERYELVRSPKLPLYLADGEAKYIIKNESNKYVRNMKFDFEVKEGISVKMGSGDPALLTVKNVYDLIDIPPFEHIDITIKVEDRSALSHDFDELGLDLSFTLCNLAGTDLESFYEFTEPYGSTTITDSIYSHMSDCTAGTIKGDGFAYVTGKEISGSLTAPVTELSVFINGEISVAPNTVILDLTGLTLKTDENIKLYLENSLGTANSSLTANGSAIGLSVKEDRCIISVDGKTEELSFTAEAMDQVAVKGITGKLSSLIIYNKYQDTAIHKLNSEL